MYSLILIYSSEEWLKGHSVDKFKVGDKVKYIVDGSLKGIKGVVKSVLPNGTKGQPFGVDKLLNEVDTDKGKLFLFDEEIEKC
jgi:hypothetical protein